MIAVIIKINITILSNAANVFKLAYRLAIKTVVYLVWPRIEDSNVNGWRQWGKNLPGDGSKDAKTSAIQEGRPLDRVETTELGPKTGQFPLIWIAVMNSVETWGHYQVRSFARRYKKRPDRPATRAFWFREGRRLLASYLKDQVKASSRTDWSSRCP